jgi:hypothetical protein
MDFPWHSCGSSNKDEGDDDDEQEHKQEQEQEWEPNPEIEKRTHPMARWARFLMPLTCGATIDGRGELGQPSGQHWLEGWSTALLNH